ncbi:MAG: hypothetical protein ACLQE9_07145 [Roseiarcus sp.]
MVAGKPTLFIAAAALGAAWFPGAAAALIQPEIGAISCELFLGDIDTNPADYLLYRAFIQGYLAARAGADDRRNDAAAMSSVVSYCKGHAKEEFASAIASALKK